MDALQTSSRGNDLGPILKLNKCAPWLKTDKLHSVRILEGLQSQRNNEDCDIRFETDDVTKENVQVLLPAANILQLDFVSAACAMFLQKQLESVIAE
ncbi:unnamed protein product [Macrosiphum euphorbiae]|uniref:Uncharacterized protein n=1 Tax=Macrosiphum euphorbiae TaxID=13131 RepID=A0AAV0Y6Q8_9HEMI|nr:unnamed protein product [Macrosiphum euphorbiae]